MCLHPKLSDGSRGLYDCVQLAEIYDCFATFGAISLLICTHTSHVGIFNLIIRKIVK